MLLKKIFINIIIDVIRAINGSHISIKAPIDHQNYYTNRKLIILQGN